MYVVGDSALTRHGELRSKKIVSPVQVFAEEGRVIKQVPTAGTKLDTSVEGNDAVTDRPRRFHAKRPIFGFLGRAWP